jgi:dienelactone hydrolase
MNTSVQVSDAVRIKIHKATNGSGAIIINYPGYNGSVDGYAYKYAKIAGLLQQKGVGTVIRMNNQEREGVPYPKSLVEDFGKVIDYALKNAHFLSGAIHPKIYLMGFSAGASAVAAVAAIYPQIKKILLVAPSGDAGITLMKRGLGGFEGDVYGVAGAQDVIATQDFCEKVLSWAKNARMRSLAMIPNCEHQFKGKRNGMILSKAPLWAFVGDATFPEPDGGIVLYS